VVTEASGREAAGDDPTLTSSARWFDVGDGAQATAIRNRAWVVFDLGSGIRSMGGTRLVPNGCLEEAQTLARCMSYKLASAGRRLGGAKAVICAVDGERSTAMEEFQLGIAPLVTSRRFFTGPDIGTTQKDFTPHAGRHPDRTDTVTRTAAGIIGAALASSGSLKDKTVAVEGFGQVGREVSLRMINLGARIVSVSDVTASVHEPGGLPVRELIKRIVMSPHHTLSQEFHARPREDIFTCDADFLIPAARGFSITGERARSLRPSVIIPAANAPYTLEGLSVLRERGIEAHADFITSSGAVMPDTLDLADITNEVLGLSRQACRHSDGPYAGGETIATTFLKGWFPGPIGPPIASNAAFNEH